MYFKGVLKKNNILYKLCSVLLQIGKLCWIKFDDDCMRMTVIPPGNNNMPQVWTVLAYDSVWEWHKVSSRLDNNEVSLEINVRNLYLALRSTIDVPKCEVRLTRQNLSAYLRIRIRKMSAWKRAAILEYRGLRPTMPTSGGAVPFNDGPPQLPLVGQAAMQPQPAHLQDGGVSRARDLEEGMIEVTHEVPVRVIEMESMRGTVEPLTREPDVYIQLPAVNKLKSISDRYTRLALKAVKQGIGLQGLKKARIDVWATMHGHLRLNYRDETLTLQSQWESLENVRPNVEDLEDGEEGLRTHPSTKLMEMENDQDGHRGWAKVRVDGREWGRMLALGRLSGDAVLALCHDNCVIVYVYLKDPNNPKVADGSTMTYYLNSYNFD